MAGTTAPILGLVCCRRAIGEARAQAVMDRYVAAASEGAGANVVLLPNLPGSLDPVAIAGVLDGLLLTGSPSNVAPSRYAEADPGTAPFDPDRDDAVLRLVPALLASGKPVFGICRGLQELNVAFGGTLRRALPDPALHHAPEGATQDAMFAHAHAIGLAPGGVLAEAGAPLAISVNSVHFQGIGRLGDGLRVEATAPDGVVEAFSARVGRAQVLAVQWHPEWAPVPGPGGRLFFYLLGRALRGGI